MQHFASHAKEETVFFHAWGGSPQINAYIAWVGEQVYEQYGIDLKHVKLANTSDAVNQVLSQKASNPKATGNIDLIWVNGENFASMANNDLLIPGWASSLNNFALTNPTENPDVLYDFGVPTLGRESPWGRASLIFYYNSRHLELPPKTLFQLLEWAKNTPYRFIYPYVDDFIGISFVKYALLVAAEQSPQVDHSLLYQPMVAAEFDKVTQPLWDYLDRLHPVMWQKGRFFVRDNGWLKRAFDDEEILLALSFSAGDIPASVMRYELPEATRSYTMQDGSLSNVHFVAIPFNSPNKQQAKKVANFLLSPSAQAHKHRPEIWGDATVLDIGLLTEKQASLFLNENAHPSAIDPTEKRVILSEPHPSWIPALKAAWKQRYDAN